MPAFLNLSGKRFSRLVVVSPTTRRSGGNVVFECHCDCGKTAFVSGDRLQRGNDTSCGCGRKRRWLKHGLSRHPLHKTWASLVYRCTEPTNKQWEDYGGRGITVCAEWLGDGGLERFIADMGPRPKGTSIDRIDNNGTYSPANCRWATKVEQNSNTRQNILITYNGKKQTASAWSRETGLDRSTILSRYHAGRPIEEVLAAESLSHRPLGWSKTP